MSFISFKTYKYKTQEDLKNLSAEQIANILPKDVIETIDKKKVAGVTLTIPQTRAMFFLLQLKKSAKLQPSEQFRQNEITKFLRREGSQDKEVDALIAKTTQEVDAENTAKLNKQIPNAPSNTPMPWPTAPTTPINVNRGGKWKKTRSEKRKRKSKSKKAKAKAKAKSRRKM
jgi:hypothetical protein